MQQLWKTRPFGKSVLLDCQETISAERSKARQSSKHIRKTLEDDLAEPWVKQTNSQYLTQEWIFHI